MDGQSLLEFDTLALLQSKYFTQLITTATTNATKPMGKELVKIFLNMILFILI